MDVMDNSNTEEHYSALKTISTIMKTVAVIIGIVGVISAFGALFATLPFITQIGAFIGIGVATFINVLVMWAGAELINLLISLERNTYETKVSLMQSTTKEKSIKAA